MTTQLCKVRRIRPNLEKVASIADFKQSFKNRITEALYRLRRQKI